MKLGVQAVEFAAGLAAVNGRFSHPMGFPLSRIVTVPVGLPTFGAIAILAVKVVGLLKFTGLGDAFTDVVVLSAKTVRLVELFTTEAKFVSPLYVTVTV